MVINNLANFFTLIRVILAPIIFICIIEPSLHIPALLLFVFASFTDYLDGYFARKTNSVSVIGEVIDPIADKILIVFIFFGLAVYLHSYLIAFAAGGHTASQFPHPIHNSGIITRFDGIASVGHEGIHKLHSTQSFVIIAFLT